MYIYIHHNNNPYVALIRKNIYFSEGSSVNSSPALLRAYRVHWACSLAYGGSLGPLGFLWSPEDFRKLVGYMGFP